MDERYWRGPAEHGARQASAPDPPGARPEGISRRHVLQLLGAGASVVETSACSRGPREHIVPYVEQPPEVTPARPARYATTATIDGYGTGLVVETHEGRPTKVEGNARHPASLGGVGAIEQARALSVYDPQRARFVLRDGAPDAWSPLARALASPAPPGKRVHVLLEPTSAPHLVDLIEELRRLRPDVAVHFDSPITRGHVWEGARAAFGDVLEPRWNLGEAEVIVALDADVLGAAHLPAAWARAWASRRQPADARMSRLYTIESRLSITGMAADERLRVSPREVESLAADLLAHLIAGTDAALPERARAAASARAPGRHEPWIGAAARDLLARRAAALVVAGDAQPAAVHAMVHAMNELLGAAGRTVAYGPSPVFEAGGANHGLGGLLEAIDRQEVAALVIVGGDPAYASPADLDFRGHLARVPLTAYVGPYENETSRRCTWLVPQAHEFEGWSDARAFDGTVSIAQPLIEPRFECKTAGQVLAALASLAETTSAALVERFWKSRWGTDFDERWRRALTAGLIEESASPPRDVRVDWTPIADALKRPAPSSDGGLDLVYFADGKVLDGRFANSAWLQELPDPVTKLTWDNAALVSPPTAARFGLETEDVIELTVRGRSLRAPVLVTPGTADDVVALALGYGQTTRGHLSFSVGANAYRLRDSRALWSDAVALRKLGDRYPLAVTQEHWSMEGRPIVLRQTVAARLRDPGLAMRQNEPPKLLYSLAPDATHQWGMTIDLNACTGCSACVVACMAENNVPVVGKPEVRLSREMHWIRIDRYYVGEPSDPEVVVQPMLCQHCEDAPCEYVCPVNATVHSPEGLNEMVYNRCVGTRFCSNNCPYKVRRFNFFNFNRDKAATLGLALNPDVTVRARGVMEKCTYCVQRIREAEIQARREQRPLRDGDVVTACQQTCPTGAIVFGDIADPATRVAKTRVDERLYQVLHELGTTPRTRYLARIVNPNPELHPS